MATKIVGIDQLSTHELNTELERGARFILYQYTISIIVMTFRRSSQIHFVRDGQSRVARGLPFTMVSFFFGWWGIPWGPIYTVGTLYSNLRGGKDVTTEVIQSLNAPAPAPAKS